MKASPPQSTPLPSCSPPPPPQPQPKKGRKVASWEYFLGPFITEFPFHRRHLSPRTPSQSFCVSLVPHFSHSLLSLSRSIPHHPPPIRTPLQLRHSSLSSIRSFRRSLQVFLSHRQRHIRSLGNALSIVSASLVFSLSFPIRVVIP